MKLHTVAGHALEEHLAAFIVAHPGPVPLTTCIAAGKRQGFTPSDVRYALHRLCRAGEVAFTANPTAVEVIAAGREGDQ